jgi:transposase
LSLRIRVKKAHDIKDAAYLVKRLPKTLKKLVADAAYDSEKFYKVLWDRGIMPVVKQRKNARRGFVRKKVKRYFNKKVYNRRSIVESVFFSIKRKFGASVSSVKFSSQKIEIYCRAIAHNIFSDFIGLFQQSR